MINVFSVSLCLCGSKYDVELFMHGHIALAGSVFGFRHSLVIRH